METTFLKQKKVLVTGGAGFIGSNLVRKLARNPKELVVVDSLTYAANLKNIADLVDQKEILFRKVDITDASAIESLFAEFQFDIIFHLAAESHVDRSIHGPSAFIHTNVLGTQNLLEGFRKYSKTGRFVHISTDEVYGTLGPEGVFQEEMKLDPSSPYSASKASSDLVVLAAGKTFDLDVIVTRCTNNYGPYQFPEKFIPLFITHAMEGRKLPLYGDGKNVRSWIHVDDHVRALISLAKKGRTGEIYNIGGGSDSEHENVEVAKIIVRSLGASESLIQFVKDRPAHDRRYAVDASKAHEVCGWSPQVKFSEGLQETIKWYQENRPWWEEVRGGDHMKFYQLHYGENL